MHHRKEKTESLLREIAAEFIEKESGPQSLVTVIEVTFDVKTNRSVVFLSVLPEDQENAVIDFIRRKRKDFIEFLKEKSRFKNLPTVEFHLLK